MSLYPEDNLTVATHSKTSPPLSQCRLLILEPSTIISSIPTSSSLPSVLPDQKLSTSSYLSTPQHPLIPALLQELTGQPPVQDPERISLAGYTTHPPLRVRNRYVDVKIGLWCDEVPLPGRESGNGVAEGGFGAEAVKFTAGDGQVKSRIECGAEFSRMDNDGDGTRDEPVATSEDEEALYGRHDSSATADDENSTQTWLSQMLSAEAAEVRNVIGAVVLALPVPQALEAINQSPVAESTWNPLQEEEWDSAPNHSYSKSSRWKLNDTYLSLISAVDRLRSAIQDSRPSSSTMIGDQGSQADVGAIVILQGHLPTGPAQSASKAPLVSGITTAEAEDWPIQHQDPADELIEVVEDQLLTSEASIMGWDVVLWDGKPSDGPPATSPTPAKERKEQSSSSSNTTATATKTPRQPRLNIYGEKTGMDRVKQVIETIDWTQPPSIFHPARPFSSSDSTNKGAEHGQCGEALNPERETDDEGEGADLEDEEFQVEQLESLLNQAAAIRDVATDGSSSSPSSSSRSQRERYARVMIERLMK